MTPVTSAAAILPSRKGFPRCPHPERHLNLGNGAERNVLLVGLGPSSDVGLCVCADDSTAPYCCWPSDAEEEEMVRVVGLIFLAVVQLEDSTTRL